MSKGLLGKKVGMTQVFTDEGNLVPVTVIDVTGCAVVGKRTTEKDGYSAVAIGYGDAKEKHLKKARTGYFKKVNAPLKRLIREFRLTEGEVEGINIGDNWGADLFAKGQEVDVTGTSKGRGFQGVVRRWSFGGYPQTHGTHEYRRHSGAIGQRKTPGRVYPNKKMPGHFGSEKVTTQNLTVVDVFPEKGLVLVKGAVPGSNNGIVTIRPSVKAAMRATHKKSKK